MYGNQNGVDGNVGVGYHLVFIRGDYSVMLDMKLVTMQTGSYNTFVGGYIGQGGTTSTLA